MGPEASGMAWAVAIGAPFMIACSIPIIHEAVLQYIEDRNRPPAHNCQCRRR